MIPREILQKVRRLQITTSRVVSDLMAGQYHSVFKGRGMEFDEVREYLPGDEIRTIDWNRTARMGHPFVKRYVEERELTVMLLVDASGSQHFGSREKLKTEWAAEIGALLAFSAITNNDKVGLIIFTDAVEKFVPPKKGKRHGLRVIRELLYFKPRGKGTNIAGALRYLDKVTTRRTVTFLISDFFAKNFEKDLKISSKRHDLVTMTLVDPREREIPPVGFLELEDAETGERRLLDTASRAIQMEFRRRQVERMRELEKKFRSLRVDNVVVEAGRDYVKPLMKFFRMREKRR